MDKLLEIRDQFAVLQDGGRLFHATRVMVDHDEEGPDDVSLDWDEFLGDEVTFGHSAFRVDWPSRRVQHLCFYGCRSTLNQFMGLAAQAALEIPMQLLPRISPNPKDREARYDRDQWLLTIYRIAYQKPELIPVTRDLQRNGEGTYDQIDRGFFDPLALAAIYDTSEQHGFASWKNSFAAKKQPCPRYLYASLSLDVCRCSVLAIDHLASHRERYFQGTLSTDICDVEPFGPENDLPDKEKRFTENGKTLRDENTEARDKFIYDQVVNREDRKKIMNVVNDNAEWEHIFSRQGILAAADRYADRHDLPEPPRKR